MKISTAHEISQCLVMFLLCIGIHAFLINAYFTHLIVHIQFLHAYFTHLFCIFNFFCTSYMLSMHYFVIWMFSLSLFAFASNSKIRQANSHKFEVLYGII